MPACVKRACQKGNSSNWFKARGMPIRGFERFEEFEEFEMFEGF